MSAGKFISLEEVRKDPKLLRRWVRERIVAGQGEGDQTRFHDALKAMLKASPVAAKASRTRCDAAKRKRPGFLP
jgi:hypothetical protein